jgi:anti-sigma factor RsiW
MLKILAAYIDDRLSKSERAHITAHFAGCDRCFSIYISTAQPLFDLSEE